MTAIEMSIPEYDRLVWVVKFPCGEQIPSCYKTCKRQLASTSFYETGWDGPCANLLVSKACMHSGTLLCLLSGQSSFGKLLTVQRPQLSNEICLQGKKLLSNIFFFYYCNETDCFFHGWNTPLVRSQLKKLMRKACKSQMFLWSFC